MKTTTPGLAALVLCAALPLLVAWTSLPVKDDPLLFMPGTQPGGASLESAGRCDNCHGGYNSAVEPAHNWRGSMMAHAARDPLWQACRTVALQDSIWALGNPNAGDLCIRCHTPTGWLGGHSDPANGTALAGSDFEGVSCDACHRAVDPMHGLRQAELGLETTSLGQTEAEKTFVQDGTVLAAHRLFAGGPFYDPATKLPKYYGDGYIEATSGQYFIDAGNAKRGPRADAAPKHQFFYSRFHKTRYVCGTCHDVSNPVLARLGGDDPEKEAAGFYAHVERTFSEFQLSAYGRPGGAAADPKIGVGMVTKCQDCHMRDVTGYAANKVGIPLRTDLALHDQTGGNAWISGILASIDQTGPVYDATNYAILSGARYPGAKIDVTGVQGYGAALLAGRDRALQQLRMAATIQPVLDAPGTLGLRIVNHSGHKLISGFPEGRRMWLNVKFLDSTGALVGEINPYVPLAADGSGGDLAETDDDLVYETKMSSDHLTREEKTFHFVLATGRYKDNRIPPKGFDIANAVVRHATPVEDGANAPDYFTAAEYAGGYDEVLIDKPAGAVAWVATLYYQTTSRDYVEFLRDEINGVNKTLAEPAPAGDPTAYLAQTDPYFSSLRDWGRAIWDLWLHNGGCPPVAMASVSGGSYQPPCDAPAAAPSNLVATAGKRSVKLSWTPVSGVAGYRIYYAQGGKYTLVGAVSGSATTTYTDSGLKAGQSYTYAVTAYVNCADGSIKESAYSSTATATALR